MPATWLLTGYSRSSPPQLSAVLRVFASVPGVSEPLPAVVGQDATIEAALTRQRVGSPLDSHIERRRTAVGDLAVETPTPNQPCGLAAQARKRDRVVIRVLFEEDPAYQFD